MTTIESIDLITLADNIKAWGKALGFQHVGISDVDLSHHEEYLQRWLDAGYHGEMTYMESHGLLRAKPAELLPGTLRAIAVRYDYLPANAKFATDLANPNTAYISRYALGRDYHKVVRKKLKQLGDKIKGEVSTANFRPFVDSAPILEHAIAEKAGIGWTGKHSLTLNQDAGSWFFLGELLINVPLPTDQPVKEQCGSCAACMTICPTQAIVAPYTVDARKCISYLTIEQDGDIPEELRPLIGNRIYGCDDCQLVCPFNKDAPLSSEADFTPRQVLMSKPLAELMRWTEEEFLKHTEGSPIRRIGYARWQRNIAVGLGNADCTEQNVIALQRAKGQVNAMVDNHIEWALEQLACRAENGAAVTRQQRRLVRSIRKGLFRDA